MGEDMRARRRLTIGGLVQGVGFRPFVYSWARQMALSGSVTNTAQGVVVEVEGAPVNLDRFARRLRDEAPSAARIERLAVESLPCQGGTEFEIIASESGTGRTLVSPDLGTCAECLTELADPGDRRFRHAFISCTNCGPRFTIIRHVPYDRSTTTMAGLPLCAACAAEYADPADRRFHAQTVACPECGPTLTFRQRGWTARAGEAMTAARRVLAAGGIVAVKGIGGYHLTCDAASPEAVAALRTRKRRGDKPMAVMVADVGDADLIAYASPAERELLQDPRHPVVLLSRRGEPGLSVADGVAPGLPELGVVTAYTPVHRLLFGLPGDPPGPRVLVMTSGNRAGAPIVTADDDALAWLEPLADALLMHDRPIEVPCDDSVVRIVAGDEMPIRRSRGYAPLPIALPFSVVPALAVGGDLKNTFGIAAGRYAWLSAHVGDMEDVATIRRFGVAIGHLSALVRVEPEVIVADRHPGYRSVDWARHHAGDRPVVQVQHHHAHIASVLAENGHDGTVIGFAFDGTGFGDDGAVWGGEVLLGGYDGFERVGHLDYVPLPGADSAVRNPCRMALAHLRAAGVEWSPKLPCVAACPPDELRVLDRQLERGIGCVPTSSMGRLFDAMSSLVGLTHRTTYEAEAAMRFEGLARGVEADQVYRFGLRRHESRLLADPSPVVAAAAADVLSGVLPSVVAARFHAAVADLILVLARQVRAGTGVTVAALSGGVFLNAVLTVAAVQRLKRHGFQVLQHRLVPPSDAGLALGQLVLGAPREATETG